MLVRNVLIKVVAITGRVRGVKATERTVIAKGYQPLILTCNELARKRTSKPLWYKHLRFDGENDFGINVIKINDMEEQKRCCGNCKFWSGTHKYRFCLVHRATKSEKNKCKKFSAR